jgi:fused signal recognition particle receptor
MDELEKILRVIRKLDATAPHAALLVLDATVGQNALGQVEAFTKVAGITGLVMTKLDGTAKGGILVAVAAKFGLPVHFIGVGESVEDLQPFEAGEFARALVGLENKPSSGACPGTPPKASRSPGTATLFLESRNRAPARGMAASRNDRDLILASRPRI